MQQQQPTSNNTHFHFQTKYSDPSEWQFKPKNLDIVSWFWCFLHDVRDEFTDDVSEAALGPIFTGQELERKWATEWGAASWPAVSETSSINSPSTPCKNPKTKKQYSFHGESLKSKTNLELLSIHFPVPTTCTLCTKSNFSLDTLLQYAPK